ncbi:MAG: serine hydrolase [Proteobacteria bacterium]|nr:serine hydrolase [Pseudomonadota bacterium]
MSFLLLWSIYRLVYRRVTAWIARCLPFPAKLLMIAIFANVSFASGSPSSSLEDLEKNVSQIIRDNGVPGAAIVVVRKDEALWLKGFGRTDLQGHQAVDEQTLFSVASFSKTFVAMGLSILQERGLVDLQTPIRDIAPEIPIDNPWENEAPVRIVHLLEHTAAFDDCLIADFLAPSSWTIPPPLLEVFKSFPQRLKVRWRPGEKTSYLNCTDYTVAAYLIEKISHSRYEDFLKQNILAPLAMDLSTFDESEIKNHPYAKSHRGRQEVNFNGRFRYYRAQGSLWTSASDFGRFLRMILSRGNLDNRQIINEADLKRMETPRSSLAAIQGIDFGYGLGIYGDHVGRTPLLGHDGAGPGQLSLYQYSVAADVAFAMFLNSRPDTLSTLKPHNAANAFYAIRKLLVTRFVPTSSEPPSESLNSELLDDCVGVFEVTITSPTVMTPLRLLTGIRLVVRTNDRLSIFSLRGKDVLIPTGKGLFRWEGNTKAEIACGTSSDGDRYLADAGFDGYYTRVNPMWPLLRIILALSTFGAMGSSLLFGILAFLSKQRWLLLLYAGPFFAALSSLIVILMAFLNADPVVLQRVGIASISIFVGSIALPCFGLIGTAAALYYYTSKRPDVQSGHRLHALAVSVLFIIAAMYLCRWGIIGFRTWAD